MPKKRMGTEQSQKLKPLEQTIRRLEKLVASPSRGWQVFKNIHNSSTDES
jgi:hypothetical protein